jgi:drug/metabolite transporter (DMT)-like permease
VWRPCCIMGSMPAATRPRTASLSLVVLALGTVYVVWGSTYLGIRVAIETLPPMLMSGVRFMTAGALLYAFAIRRGDTVGDRPGRAQWLAATVVGGALLLCGNGGVAWGEQFVPSGLASLLIATVPLWMVLFARLLFGDRLTWPARIGVAVGFAGLVLLVAPGAGGIGDAQPLATAVMLTGAACWGWGSVHARRAALPRRPLVSTAMQMLAGGGLQILAGTALGELGRVELGAVSTRSLLAVAYLVVFGSLAAFTAYSWLLRNVPTALASTYAYVNPLVAVALGWALLGEQVTVRSLVAGAIILTGVALIITAGGRRPRPEAAPEPAREGVG